MIEVELVLFKGTLRYVKVLLEVWYEVVPEWVSKLCNVKVVIL